MTLALVTGANRGIGLEIAKQLAQEPDTTVILTARSQDKADTSAESLRGDGLDVVPMTVDIIDPASITQLAKAISSRYDSLDILVNNAAAFADWSEMPSTANIDDAIALMNTNLFGTWRMCIAFLPLLKASIHGRIVNVGSGAGTFSDPYFGLSGNGGAAATYGISKAALHALTVKLAAELADTSVSVNAAGPGLTATSPGMEAMGARPVAAGAASIVKVALFPPDGPRGGFFRDGEAINW
ncbi:MAG: SDR family NAD(P)-dependent oxidoreductase [Chloroflexota bacterium]